MAIFETVDIGFGFDNTGVGLGFPNYDENDWATLGRGGLMYDYDADRGVYYGAGNEFLIAAVPAAQQVTIETGFGIVNGTWAGTDVLKTLDVPANVLGAPRLDRVVLRIDTSDPVESAELRVLIGTTLAYAALTQVSPDGIWDIPLWRWESPNGFADLTTVTFIDDRRWANLPEVTAYTLTNNSGVDRIAGEVIIQDIGAASSFTTTTIIGNRCLGVTAEPIASGASGKVITRGLARVYCTAGVVAVGDFLQPSATAGQAQTGAGGAFARAVTAKGAGAGYVTAYMTEEQTPPIASVTRGVLAIADNTLTTITWTTARVNNAAMWSAGAPTIFTVLAAGVYQINAVVSWQDQGAQQWQAMYAQVLQNAGVILKFLNDMLNGGLLISFAMSGIVSASAGDTFSVQIFQDNLANVAANIERADFNIVRIGNA